MPREPVAMIIADLSVFARRLQRDIAGRGIPPGHLALLNSVSRAAGFGNFQHLRSQGEAARTLVSPVVPVVATAPDAQLLDRALRAFDAEGRMVRWPSKTAVQCLCLWALWAHLPSKVSLAEADLNARIDNWHSFGDRAILRRSLIGHGLATRQADGQNYRRVERVPPAEALALIRHLAARHA